MARLSITTAWNEATVFVQREAALLLPVAFALSALPSAVAQHIVPTPIPGELPEMGSWVFYIIPLMIISILGTLTLSTMALRPGSSVGEAITHALNRIIPLLLATFLLGLGVGIVAGIIGAIAGFGLIPLAIFIGVVAFPFLLYAMIRMFLINPIAAAEPIGPVDMIKRSWALTEGHFWKLLGFIILFSIVSIVVTLAVTSIIGIILSILLPKSLVVLLSLLVSAAVSAVVNVFVVVTLVRIYAQLSAG